jgi:eukaryotic-like serine/threonine-protein kinase
MKPESWQQLDQLFHSALERQPSERAAFLDEACGGDDTLHKQVEALLAAQEEAGSFIERPALEVEARSVADEQNELAAGQIIGHYQIVSQLGVGGMGEVYLAEDATLGRKVALKLLPADFTRDIDRLRRFQQEARAASGLNHPNIITIYEIGQVDDRHFIATEFIDGDTLRFHIQGLLSQSAGGASHKFTKPSQLREILNIAIQTADALAAAHEAGIVHRDIKPENIMVRRRDGYVKVLDFGLAKLTEGLTSADDTGAPSRAQVKTSVGVVMGTASYMSPEQARGDRVDSRTDIWSLGVVLYEMVAGCAPFERSTPSEVIALILEREPAPLARYARETPPELERIVTKALTKDKEERYETAKDLMLDLRRLRQRLEVEVGIERSATLGAGSEPTEATEGTPAVATTDESAPRTDAEVLHPTSGAEYLVSEIKRHKTGALVAVAALIIAVAVTAFGLYKFIGQWRSGVKPIAAFQTMKITRLTSTGKARSAGISPDGRYVVHGVDENGQHSLWMRQVATSSNVQIVPPADFPYFHLTFSPDGNYIYYLGQEADDNDAGVLYQRPVLGGAAKKLIVDIDSPITFSPDNKQLAFVRFVPDKGESLLMLANADGTAERRLAVRKYPDTFSRDNPGPSWSPDGKVIVCNAGTTDAIEPYMNLVEVRVADGTMKPITSQRWWGVGQAVWLRDGSGLVFTARERTSSPSQLWRISYPSGEAHRITNDLNDYLGVSLTADSTALVTVQSVRPSNIWVALDGEASRATQITFSNFDGTEGIAWTPDGKIVYASLASGNSDLWITDADGSNQRQLTIDARNNSYPAPSSDGRYIVYVSDRKGSTNIWRMDRDGRNQTQLTHGSGEVFPECSPDGKWVVYNSVGDFTLWKVPMGGGDPEQLTTRCLGRPAISPDGKLIAGDDFRKTAIYPFSGGNPIKVLNTWTLHCKWTQDGRALQYIDISGRSNLYSQPLDGSPPKRLTDNKSDRIFNFDLSHDGKQLALVRGNVTNDVVLISDFRDQQ